MFTIFTSVSPLLDYINLRTYRNIEVEGLTKDIGAEVYSNVDVLCKSMDTSSHENYLTWLSVWKQVNALLSKYNHHLKNPKAYSPVYEDILRATERQIAREWGLKTHAEFDAARDFIREEFELRRLNYISWAGSALTTLYNARDDGKVLTSRIVEANRRNEGGLFAKVCRFFSKAA